MSWYNCCCKCKCTCSQDRWDDLGEAFSFSQNVGTANVTLTKITDDGTTLACRQYVRSPDPPTATATGIWSDTKVVSQRKPCLQVDADIRWSDPGLSGYTPCEYIFGRMYPSCAVVPNGYNIWLQFRLDSAFRYYRQAYRIVKASDGTVLDTPDTVAVDADATPQVGGYHVAKQFAPSFCIKQNGRIFFLKEQLSFATALAHAVTKRIEGTTGRDIDNVWVGSPTPSAGNKPSDWLRCVTHNGLGYFLSQYFSMQTSTPAQMWYTWANPATPQAAAYRTDIQPNLCDTDHPISFGWYWRIFSAHQYGYLDLGPPESPTNPYKNSTSTITHWRSRIDSWCVDHAVSTVFLDCPELSVCCDSPPSTIHVSVDSAGIGSCYKGSGNFTLPRVPSGGIQSRWYGRDDEGDEWLILCQDEVWKIISPNTNITITGAVSSSCDPFEIVFQKTAGACIGTVVTVTA